MCGNDVASQIIGRASQVRGSAKTTSRPYFVSLYNIESLGSKREIRDKVEQLLEGYRFVYKVNCYHHRYMLAYSLHLGSCFEDGYISCAVDTDHY